MPTKNDISKYLIIALQLNDIFLLFPPLFDKYFDYAPILLMYFAVPPELDTTIPSVIINTVNHHVWNSLVFLQKVLPIHCNCGCEWPLNYSFYSSNLTQKLMRYHTVPPTPIK